MRPPIAAVALAVLVAALAGCVAPDVDKSAIVSYLNGDVDARAVGCPFPVHDDAEEGIVASPNAHDLAVAPDGRILLAQAGSIRVVSPGLNDTADWSLPLTTDDVRIDASRDVVAAVQKADATTARVTTFDLDGTPIASRNVSADWQADVAVHDEGVWLSTPTSDGAALTVYAPNLTADRRIDLEPPAPVHDVARCGQATYRLTGDAPPARADALRAAGPGIDNGTEVAAYHDGRRLDVGHDLAFVAGGADDHRWLQVHHVNGTRLLTIDNDDGRSYGTFEVAHGMVYNLRADTTLVRPLADYLTRPS